MQPADSLAHEALQRLITAGGSWGIGLSSTVPSFAAGAITNVTDVTEVAHGTIARSDAAWDAPSGRAVIPAADPTLGDATGDCVAVAWVLYDGATPVWGARVVDIAIASGATVVLPRSVVRLTVT